MRTLFMMMALGAILSGGCTKQTAEKWKCPECGCSADATCGCSPEGCKCKGNESAPHCGPDCKHK